MRGSSASVRLFAAAQVGLGLALTLRPERIAASAAGPTGRPAPGWLVRVLGLRSVLQGAVTLAVPTSAVLAGGALVDTTHATSMAPLVLASSNYRRAAAISAVTALASAAVGTLGATRESDRERST